MPDGLPQGPSHDAAGQLECRDMDIGDQPDLGFARPRVKQKKNPQSKAISQPSLHWHPFFPRIVSPR